VSKKRVLQELIVRKMADKIECGLLAVIFDGIYLQILNRFVYLGFGFVTEI
jgi:hypothetical protein